MKETWPAFEGNAQGFRTLTQTENYLFCGGFASNIRNPWCILQVSLEQQKKQWTGEKFGAFISEETIL